ncbi:PRC-barrel domain protein [Methyloligella halotolerans]|uniref:PRC-barrel domain protein n=1 Tax=Methyloligella halotolerans TaxID=1177755 RepID=A0A1E2S2G6_9HYPH|nr:PRC-barrel domain-containing protein [Methyloligella halotolerans]ODA68706.1 PRC-barrel domain protein [Methyloligella halotolerans]
MKRILIGTIAGIFMTAGPALAQDESSEPVAPPHPTETMEQSQTAGQVNGVPAKTARFITEQSPTDALASDLIGKPVLNPARETVGQINDIIGGADGKIRGVVIGVGGFLGIGEKNVAVQYDDVVVSRNEENGKIEIMANLTKETLSAAPAYRTLEEQSVVRGEDGEVKRTY